MGSRVYEFRTAKLRRGFPDVCPGPGCGEDDRSHADRDGDRKLARLASRSVQSDICRTSWPDIACDSAVAVKVSFSR